jgi:hypothetical protein
MLMMGGGAIVMLGLVGVASGLFVCGRPVMVVDDCVCVWSAPRALAFLVGVVGRPEMDGIGGIGGLPSLSTLSLSFARSSSIRVIVLW